MALTNIVGPAHSKAFSWAYGNLSPSFSIFVSDTPACLVVTAGFDPLKDEGKEYAENLSGAEPTVSTASSIFSLVLMLGASGGCFFAWRETSLASYLVASLGFLVLAPLWYRSPVSVKAFFLAPFSGRLTPRRPFQMIDILSAFIGYALLLVALSLWLFA